MKILVIDDHAIVRHTASRLLALLGHQALEARDAREAEDTFTRHHGDFEVVLLDLCLDGTEGALLAHKLQASRSGLRILFMSGLGQEVFQAPDLAGPRRGFIEKPFSLHRLDSALQGLLLAR